MSKEAQKLAISVHFKLQLGAGARILGVHVNVNVALVTAKLEMFAATALALNVCIDDRLLRINEFEQPSFKTAVDHNLRT